MHIYGAEFNQSIKLNYTRLNLYSQEPKLIGNISTIYANATLKNQTLDFYRSFQKRSDLLPQLMEIYEHITVQKEFYFYFNRLYWYLSLKEPFVKVTYFEVPLPASSKQLKKPKKHNNIFKVIH